MFIRLVMERWRFLLLTLLASLLLSGCVEYGLGVNFEGQHRGAIVQHIKLGEQLTRFSDSEAQQWLRSIERRAKQLRGSTRKISEQDIIVTIPFSNGKELASKFDQFFSPVVKKNDRSSADKGENLPSFKSQLNLVQNNFFFWQRNRLNYDLDLRSLGVISARGNVIVSPGSLLDLQFSLETPWGARSIVKADHAISPKIYYGGRQLVWTPQPGQINHMEAVFWLPSPLGVGTFLIVLFILGGFYLKYKTFPWTPTSTT
ncbi:MAG: DUF3153 domain-containing protein [Symploca sp. SIO1C4]|uniref:DUF3153 domain-containing protein n=1 Tax=Symploca sp. SIO1C4 TaxID=2607765 RepID=A0A6B3ND52_9CYAN|nr:DUF3153 domain-containing protein [Symploca sp. SIO1C4]NET04930.1 DUF3153 domain-containing protein [Symploca sp. SIO2B6]NET49507.1 DUF3153 domain-containing protein [Merismopedia sp. SIO2A8]